MSRDAERLHLRSRLVVVSGVVVTVLVFWAMIAAIIVIWLA
jgi:hypothetical protein